MSRTDTAVQVIGASPDRVFAALTDSDAPAGWPKPVTLQKLISAQTVELLHRS